MGKGIQEPLLHLLCTKANIHIYNVHPILCPSMHVFFSVSNVSWHFLLWSVKVGVVYLCKLSLISKFQEEIKKHSATSQEYGNSVHQKWVWYWVCSFAGGSELMEAITAGSTPMHADQWME